MALKEYNKKRNFDVTKEPAGEVRPNYDDKLRFVIQKHEASRLHYDFRLEYMGVFLSRAIPKGPSYNPKDKRLAARTEDHPYDYRNFEGNIPKGQYGAGTVMIWDEGYRQIKDGFDIGKSLEKGELKFTLFGQRLKGNRVLIKMKPKKPSEDNWLLIKEKDEYANDKRNIDDYDTSIRTERKMYEIKNGG